MNRAATACSAPSHGAATTPVSSSFPACSAAEHLRALAPVHLHLGISRGHGHGRPHGRHSAAEPPRCLATPSTAAPSFDCDLAQEPAASPSPPATLAVEQELRALAA